MRRFLTGLLIIFTASSLYAQVELNIASSNNEPERKAVFRYLMDAFELYNPDISVNILSYNDADGLRVIREGYGGPVPDMIIADSLILSAFSGNSFLDLELTAQILDSMGTSLFYKGPLDALEKESRYIGIPFSAWLQVIWYRTDWFSERNLNPPSTIEDLLTAARLFSSIDGINGVIAGERNDVYTQQCFLHLAEAFGLNIREDSVGLYLERELIEKTVDYYSELTDCTPQER